MVVDVKALREINNTQGYDIGDEVLRKVARRLAAVFGVPFEIRGFAFNVPPEILTLEITESVFEQHSQALKRDLEALSAMVVRLSLDDFGTGYSSLAHLNDYFFDEIKIDKSFVFKLDKEPYA